MYIVSIFKFSAQVILYFMYLFVYILLSEMMKTKNILEPS